MHMIKFTESICTKMSKCHSKLELRSDNVCTSTNRETKKDTSNKKYQKWKKK